MIKLIVVAVVAVSGFCSLDWLKAFAIYVTYCAWLECFGFIVFVCHRFCRVLVQSVLVSIRCLQSLVPKRFGKYLLPAEFGTKSFGKYLLPAESGTKRFGKYLVPAESGTKRFGKYLLPAESGTKRFGKYLLPAEFGTKRFGKYLLPAEFGTKRFGKYLVPAEFGTACRVWYKAFW